MKTVFVVMEKFWRGVYISKIFSTLSDALAYQTGMRGDEEFYDFDSAYQYWIEKWEVV